MLTRPSWGLRCHWPAVSPVTPRSRGRTSTASPQAALASTAAAASAAHHDSNALRVCGVKMRRPAKQVEHQAAQARAAGACSSMPVSRHRSSPGRRAPGGRRRADAAARARPRGSRTRWRAGPASTRDGRRRPTRWRARRRPLSTSSNRRRVRSTGPCRLGRGDDGPQPSDPQTDPQDRAAPIHEEMRRHLGGPDSHTRAARARARARWPRRSALRQRARTRRWCARAWAAPGRRRGRSGCAMPGPGRCREGSRAAGRARRPATRRTASRRTPRTPARPGSPPTDRARSPRAAGRLRAELGSWSE